MKSESNFLEDFDEAPSMKIGSEAT